MNEIKRNLDLTLDDQEAELYQQFYKNTSTLLGKHRLSNYDAELVLSDLRAAKKQLMDQRTEIRNAKEVKDTVSKDFSHLGIGIDWG